MSIIYRSVLPFVLLAAANPASAEVLDFEGLTGGTPGVGYTRYDPLETHGYVLSAVGGVDVFDPSVNLGINYPGSFTALADDYVPLTLTRAGGGAFDVLGLKAANFFPQSYGYGVTTVTFTGSFAAGGQIVRTITLDPTDAFQSLSFIGFTGLSSFTIDDSKSTGDNGQYDDIVVNAVPEPTSMAMLGLGAVALLKRRKRG